MGAMRATTREALARRLEEARGRTRHLLRTTSDEDLAVQNDPVMSPLIWDHGHIDAYEKLWLPEKAFGRGRRRPEDKPADS
jgi:iron(II)-dependent oxidoreductase